MSGNLTCNPGVFSSNSSSSSSLSLRLSNPYGGIPENLLWNAVGWTALVAAFGLLRRLAGNYGLLGALARNARSPPDSPWTQLFYQGGSDREEISLFRLSGEPLEALLGNDAAQYLSFQRHLIFLSAALCLASLSIVLPLNFSGELQGTADDFGHTTISNLQGEDPRLWAHALLALLFLPLGLAIMRRFTNTLRGPLESTSRRTLMLARVPRSFCSQEKLKAFFNAKVPSAEIDTVSIARDVSKLTSLEADWRRCREARLHCENTAADLTVRGPTPCSPSLPALPYYADLEKRLRKNFLVQKAIANSGSIGVAFITFRKADGLEAALRVLKGPWTRSVPLESELKPWKWRYRPAPPPEDIIWENLDYDSHRGFFLKMLLVNLSLFGLLFVFTSPAVILSQLQLFLRTIFGEGASLPSKMNDFLPTLLLWTLSALLPNAVAVTDVWLMGHWRRSVENIWVMRKIFFYLLFMVLILPSVGLTSLLALARAAFSQGPQWDCMFLPDSGAFFVNYVITSSLVGTGLELIRFSELFLYALRMLAAKSQAEISSVRSAVLYEFPFGYNYGWMLLIFALTTSYSMVCPLITPFGLFYMIMKHAVDRYNLLYAYKRSKINRSMHLLAVNCVTLSLLFMQVILLFFNVLRTPLGSPRTIFSMAALTISSLAFLGNMALSALENPNGRKKSSSGENSSEDEEVPSEAYVPPVLSAIKAMASPSESNYGTLDREEERPL